MINLNEGRNGFKAIGNTYPLAGNIRRKDVKIAGVPCAWFTPFDAIENEVVIYIHGGAFIFGSVDSHAPMVSHIAQTLQREVLMIDYRLAPEHPFPAGIDDCVKVINTLADSKPAIKFGIIGDSAGGNLTIATQLILKATNGPAPRFSIVISPWADIECKNPSFERNKEVDTVLARVYLMEAADMYAGGIELSNPLLSPVNGNFRGFAPMLILCGTYEILEDDSRILYERLLKSGVNAEAKFFEKALHVWPFMDISSRDSQTALADMAAFVAKHMTVNY